MHARRRFAYTLVALFVVGASPAPAQSADLPAMKAAYARPTVVPFPADNPYSPDREALGRTLFFDPRLSGSNIMSCATCHNPAFSWGDGLPKGVGHGMKPLGRRTPTVLNLAWAELLFWDGRAEGLEEQALGPIQSAAEMNLALADLVPKVQAIRGYRPLFQMAYPNEGISEKTIAKALATFERTIVSGVAPFDEWVAGKDDAISPAAKRGFVLFNTKANCAACHKGWNFTDGSFHDIGAKTDDPGRGKLVPNVQKLRHAMKTPTLRNVDRRAPYLHNGSEPTLEAVIDLYDRGGVSRPSRSGDVRPLGLSREEKADLLAFLQTLTSHDRPVAIPTLPR